MLNSTRQTVLITAALILTILTTPFAAAETLSADNSNITTVLNNAVSGDTLELEDDTYNTNLTITTSNTTIKSADGANPTFSVNRNDGTPAIAVDADTVTLSGLTIERTNSGSQVAQAVRVAGSDITLDDNTYTASGTNDAAIGIFTDSSGAAGNPDVSGETFDNIEIKGGEIKDSQTGILVADSGDASFAEDAVTVTEADFTKNDDHVVGLDTNSDAMNTTAVLNDNTFGTAASPNTIDKTVAGFSVDTLIASQLQSAINAAATDATIKTKEGDYDESVKLNVEGLTLRGPNAGVPGDASRDDESTITQGLNVKANGITVNGIAVSNDDTNGIRFGPNTVPDDVMIKNSVVSDVTGSTFQRGGKDAGAANGIQFQFASGSPESKTADNVTLVDNLIEDISTPSATKRTTAVGINVLPRGNNIELAILGNTVKDVTAGASSANDERARAVSIDTQDDATDGTGRVNGVEIKNNMFSDITGSDQVWAVSLFEDSGLTPRGGVENFNISNNEFTDLIAPQSDRGPVAVFIGGYQDLGDHHAITQNTVRSGSLFRYSQPQSGFDPTRADSLNATGNTFTDEFAELYYSDGTSNANTSEVLQDNTFNPNNNVRVEAIGPIIIPAGTAPDHTVLNLDTGRVDQTLTNAIKNANTNNTLRVGSGTFAESVTVDVESLTVRSAENHGAKITAPTGKKAVKVSTNNVSLGGLHIKGANGRPAIEVTTGDINTGTFTLTNAKVSSGQGVANTVLIAGDADGFQGPARVAIKDSTLNDNSGTAALNVFPGAQEAVTVTNTEFNGDPGGLRAINNLTFTDNTVTLTTQYGLDIEAVKNSTISNNAFDATAQNANIFIQDDNNSLNLTNVLSGQGNQYTPDATIAGNAIVPDAGKKEVLNVDTGDRYNGDDAISEAIDNAATGDTLRIGEGQFKDRVTADVDGLTLQGTGTNQTNLTHTTQSDNKPTLLVRANNVSIHDLTVKRRTTGTTTFSQAVKIRGKNAGIHDARLTATTGSNDGESFALYVQGRPIVGFQNPLKGPVGVNVTDTVIADSDTGFLTESSTKTGFVATNYSVTFDNVIFQNNTEHVIEAGGNVDVLDMTALLAEQSVSFDQAATPQAISPAVNTALTKKGLLPIKTAFTSTIHDARNLSAANNNVKVLPGQYEPFDAKRNISFESVSGPSNTVINVGDGERIKISESNNNVSFKGFTVSFTGAGIYNRGSNNAFINNRFISASDDDDPHAIRVEGLSGNNTIRSNTFEEADASPGSAGNGIIISQPLGTLVVNNSFDANTIGVNVGNKNPDAETTNLTVTGNTFKNHDFAGIAINRDVSQDAQPPSLHITENVFFDNAYGIFEARDPGHDINATNNTFEKNAVHYDKNTEPRIPNPILDFLDNNTFDRYAYVNGTRTVYRSPVDAAGERVSDTSDKRYTWTADGGNLTEIEGKLEVTAEPRADNITFTATGPSDYDFSRDLMTFTFDNDADGIADIQVQKDENWYTKVIASDEEPSWTRMKCIRRSEIGGSELRREEYNYDYDCPFFVLDVNADNDTFSVTLPTKQGETPGLHSPYRFGVDADATERGDGQVFLSSDRRLWCNEDSCTSSEYYIPMTTAEPLPSQVLGGVYGTEVLYEVNDSDSLRVSNGGDASLTTNTTNAVAELDEADIEELSNRVTPYFDLHKDEGTATIRYPQSELDDIEDPTFARYDEDKNRWEPRETIAEDGFIATTTEEFSIWAINGTEEETDTGGGSDGGSDNDGGAGGGGGGFATVADTDDTEDVNESDNTTDDTTDDDVNGTVIEPEDQQPPVPDTNATTTGTDDTTTGANDAVNETQGQEPQPQQGGTGIGGFITANTPSLIGALVGVLIIGGIVWYVRRP